MEQRRSVGGCPGVSPARETPQVSPSACTAPHVVPRPRTAAARGTGGPSPLVLCHMGSMRELVGLPWAGRGARGLLVAALTEIDQRHTRRSVTS